MLYNDLTNNQYMTLEIKMFFFFRSLSLKRRELISTDTKLKKKELKIKNEKKKS